MKTSFSQYLTRVSLLAVSLVVFASMSLATPVSAQTAQNTPSGTGQALEIAPPVITLSADPGQVIKTQISLRDISSGNLLVKGQVNDFVAAGEDGTPKIILDENEENPYSMKSWVAPLPDITLVPRQIKNLPVTINVPANAAPGGYYGVIRFTATPPELEGQGVSLSTSLGALMLVTVKGKATEKLEIAEFSIGKDGKSGSMFESTPIQFVQRLKNTGNLHQQPVGQVTVTDMFGKKVGAVNVNLPPRNILPQSTRKFEQPFDSSVLGNKKLFGRYKADLSVTYGVDKQVLTSSVTFWIIPYKLIAVGVIVLIGGFFALRFAIKRYNKRIISKATSSNSSSKRKR